MNLRTTFSLCIGLIGTLQGINLAQVANAMQSTENSDCSVQVLGSQDTNITAICNNSGRAATIDNDPVLLAREISDFQSTMSNFMDQSNQIGVVQPGTKVEIIGEVEAGSSVFERLAKIKILEGGFSGQTGWIYANRIQYRNVSD